MSRALAARIGGSIGTDRGGGTAQRIRLARRLGAGEQRRGGPRTGAQRAHVVREVGRGYDRGYGRWASHSLSLVRIGE